MSYDHRRYEPRRRFLRFLLRWIGFTVLVKMDRVEGAENVPAQGPAILMINHIAFVGPIVVLSMLPRNIVPLAKAEVYNYPLVGIFPRIWGVIPVKREEFDRHAIQSVLEVLRAGEIVLVAPEAHRSPALQSAKEGVAYLGTRSGAPIVPVAVEGTEGYPSLPFLPRWRGPGAQLKFGKPFRFRCDEPRPGREALCKMTTEAMYVLSAMLPEKRRGVYADFSQASQDTIEWL